MTDWPSLARHGDCSMLITNLTDSMLIILWSLSSALKMKLRKICNCSLQKMKYLINSRHMLSYFRIIVLHSASPVILPSDCGGQGGRRGGRGGRVWKCVFAGFLGSRHLDKLSGLLFIHRCLSGS